MTQELEESELRPEPAPVETPKKEESSEDSKSPDAALIDALRQFIHHAARQAGPNEQPPPVQIKVVEALVLLVVVLDIVLLYSQFQNWLEAPLFKIALQVLPWLLGATAFAYSDRTRKWILAKCSDPVLGVIAIFIALPLLVVRLPVFSVVASLSSGSVSAKADNPNEALDFTPIDSTHVRITVPDLMQSYRIKVSDANTALNPSDFSVTLGRWKVVTGTFAQIPLLGRIFRPRPLQLTALYKIQTVSTKMEGWATITGKFDPFFLRDISRLSDFRCWEVRSAQPGLQAIRCRIPKDFDALVLPACDFSLSVERGDCKATLPGTRHFPKAEDQGVNLDTICPN